MVLVLDGYSDIDLHVTSNLRYLIRLRHLIRFSGVTNWILIRKYLFSCMRVQHILSYHLIFVPWIWVRFEFWIARISRLFHIRYQGGFSIPYPTWYPANIRFIIRLWAIYGIKPSTKTGNPATGYRPVWYPSHPLILITYFGLIVYSLVFIYQVAI